MDHEFDGSMLNELSSLRGRVVRLTPLLAQFSERRKDILVEGKASKLQRTQQTCWTVVVVVVQCSWVADSPLSLNPTSSLLLRSSSRLLRTSRLLVRPRSRYRPYCLKMKDPNCQSSHRHNSRIRCNLESTAAFPSFIRNWRLARFQSLSYFFLADAPSCPHSVFESTVSGQTRHGSQYM
jgi:hypothetical protein